MTDIKSKVPWQQHPEVPTMQLWSEFNWWKNREKLRSLVGRESVGKEMRRGHLSNLSNLLHLLQLWGDPFISWMGHVFPPKSFVKTITQVKDYILTSPMLVSVFMCVCVWKCAQKHSYMCRSHLYDNDKSTFLCCMCGRDGWAALLEASLKKNNNEKNNLSI